MEATGGSSASTSQAEDTPYSIQISETCSNSTQASRIEEPDLTQDNITDDNQPRRLSSCLLSRYLNPELYFNKCVPIHEAALKGDVEEAKRLLGNDPPSILGASITKGQQTVVHIATGAKQTRFVKEMIKLMGPAAADHLKLQDENGHTAFSLAAAVGSKQIAEIMLDKSRDLLTIRGGRNNMIPLYVATLFGQTEIETFLYEKRETIRELKANARDREEIFFASIDTGLYDLAIKLLEIDPALAVARRVKKNDTPMHVLARNPSAFACRSPGQLKRLTNLRYHRNEVGPPHYKVNSSTRTSQTSLERIIKRPDVDPVELFKKPSMLLFDAVELGNFELLDELICSYPDLVHELDEHDRSIFHVAILHRRQRIFNLIHDRGFDKELLESHVDIYGNNLLHLAAKYPPPNPIKIVSGAALEMQQELLMFEEVEKIVKPPYREMKNSEGKTPQDLFTAEHTELLKDGEKWMKGTAKSCMLAATLIATVVFTAAFSVPGGNDNNKGIPIHLRKKMFQFFAVADTTALSSSSIAIVMFLFILISRYAEKDFLRLLPLQLMIGLLALFISVIGTMVAFTSSFFLAYHDRLNWVPLLTSGFACLAPILFLFLQWPLLTEVFMSTYCSKVLF